MVYLDERKPDTAPSASLEPRASADLEGAEECASRGNAGGARESDIGPTPISGLDISYQHKGAQAISWLGIIRAAQRAALGVINPPNRSKCIAANVARLSNRSE